MWDEPDDLMLMRRRHLCVRPRHGLGLPARLRAAIGRSLAIASLALLLPAIGYGQTFIRVAPPSVQQQDQSTVNAMPNTSGANGTTGASDGNSGALGEAILSANGQVVSVVDSNGKEVKNSGPWWKYWRPIFYLNVVEAYDNNIFDQPKQVGDFLTTISPGIIMGWGDYRAELPALGGYTHEFAVPVDELTAGRYLYINYHPTFEVFAKNSDQDAVEEDAVVAGSYQFTKLTLETRLEYQSLSDTDIDIGERVKRDLYTGSLVATYAYDDKTSLEDTLSLTSEQFSDLYDSYTEPEDIFYLDYQFAPKTNVSVGAAFGYIAPTHTANQIYEQALSRVRWTASDKLYATGTLGIEFRQSSDGIDKVDGVYAAGLTYLPFDGTSLVFTSSRTTQPSDAEFGQDIVLTALQLQGQQRFLGRLYAGATVGYQNANYERISGGPSFTRNDNTVNLLLTLGSDLTKYAGIQLAYRLFDNDSTIYAYGFDEQQVSFRLNLLY
jgi:hypothetical protein